MLTKRENSKIDILCTQYSMLDSVNKELQRDPTTVADVRSVFDTIIVSFPEFRTRLSPNSSIVAIKRFESALVKIQNGAFSTIPSPKIEAVNQLVVE